MRGLWCLSIVFLAFSTEYRRHFEGFVVVDGCQVDIDGCCSVRGEARKVSMAVAQWIWILSMFVTVCSRLHMRS